jgi:hypothetical protein
LTAWADRPALRLDDGRHAPLSVQIRPFASL